MYGKTRISGSLIWYGNFLATPHTQSQGGKGGGGGSSTSYTYSAALAMLLCEGPISSIATAYVDKGTDSSIANQNLTLFTGSSGQATWSYLTTNFSSQAIGYDMTAYVASGSYQMGGSAALPNLSFEPVALLSNGTYGGDAAPAALLADYCTDANHGASFPYLATLTGTNSFDDYCYSMGFFISPAELTQRSASDFIKELCDITNSEPVWKAGQLAIVPRGDVAISGNGRTYTPGNGGSGGISTPLYSFTDDDYLDDGGDPVKVSRKPGSQTFNRVRVEYLNRSNQYNVDVAEATDANDIALNGERTSQTYTFHSITTAAVARQVAQLILNRGLYYRNQYTFKVRADYCLLEPMDVVAITDSGLGLSAQLCRVIEITDDSDDRFEIVAEELPLGPGHSPQYNWAGAAGFYANTLGSPGSVATPAIFTMPSLLVSGQGGYEIGIAVAGTSGNWGGCDVYMSYDNVTYTQVGTVTGPSRYGTLRASLASNSTEPDITSTLALQLQNTALTVAGVSQTAVDNLRSLMYVDGEILAYRDASLVGTGQYNLSYFRRGKYGSTIAAHASGTLWAMLDQSLFRVPYDPGMAGKTVYFKFCSFNVYGRAYESLAAVTAYSRVIGGAAQPISASFSASATNVTQIGNSYLKTGGSAGWGNAQIYSNEGYSAGAYASAQSVDTSSQVMFGLNTDPATDASYTSLDYAWFFAAGTLQVYENGALIAGYGSYTTSTVLTVTWDGQNVRYLKDGVVQRTVSATPSKLYLDTAFNTVGGGLKNLSFGPMGSAGSNGTNGANAKLLYVISDRQIVTYDGTGAASPNVQTTTVSVVAQNLSSTTLTVAMTDSAGTAINANTYLSATGIVASGNTFTMTGTSVTMTQSAFSTARGSTPGVIITVSHADGVSDKVSIVKAQDGAAGSNGTNGTNGLNTAVIYAYQRAASAPTLPSATTTYTFATAVLTGLNNGWTTTIPTGTAPVYVTVATASGTGTTDTIAAAEWATAVVLAQNGTDGTNGSNGSNGSNGLNVATVYIYQRSASAPSLPSVTTTYTFAAASLSGLNNGWGVTIPTGTDPIWVSTATASANATTDTIGSGEWAAVSVLAQNGTNGSNGTNGTSTFLATVYQQAASAPSAPSGGSYNFNSSTLTAPTGWSTALPIVSTTNYTYATQLLFNTTTPATTVTGGTWGTPVAIAGGPVSTFTASISGYSGSVFTGAPRNLGSRTVTVTGGTSPFVYQWELIDDVWTDNTSAPEWYFSGVTTNGTATLYVQCASNNNLTGTLRCTVIDATGRTAIASATVNVTIA